MTRNKLPGYVEGGGYKPTKPFADHDNPPSSPKPKLCPLCKHDPLMHPGSHDSAQGIRSCYGCAKEMHEGKRQGDQICELTQFEVMQC